MASFRGAMHQADLPLDFIEITSGIEPFDIVEAAYLSSMVYNDFAPGTIHILATNVVATSFEGHLENQDISDQVEAVLGRSGDQF